MQFESKLLSLQSKQLTDAALLVTLQPETDSDGGRMMSDDTVTRAQLSEAVYQGVGLSRNESSDLVESVLEEITDALIREEMVKISSFGSFFVRQKSQRIGRNPKTGEEVPILPRRVLVFRPSHVLKGRINKGYEKRSDRGAPMEQGNLENGLTGSSS